MSDSVQSVRRSVRLLQVLADRPDDLSLHDVSRLAKLAPSTTHRLLQTLAQDGLVTLLPRGSFRLGPETARLGGAAMGRMRLSPVLHELMEEACRTTEETIGLVEVIDGAATVVDKVESPHPLRYELGVGTRVPTNCTASGKVLLAHSKDGTFADDITLPSDELAAIRDRGYAFDDEEYVVGLRCVAVPVRDHSGEVRFALATSGPAQRVGAERVPSLVAALRRTAGAMEHALGCRASPMPAPT